MNNIRFASSALLVALITVPAGALLQAQRAAAGVARVQERAVITCPNELGYGIRTLRSYCDVPIGIEPEQGILVDLPPHTGQVTLTFDLHNRHLYSEELIKAKQAYRRYSASIGVLTMNNHLVSRAYVHNEFRSADDLVDLIEADRSVGGVKAVAPTGSEPVSIVLPAGVTRVSILGERLTIVLPDGSVDRFTTPGRPMAVVSNVMVEYQPAPVRRPAQRR